MREPVFEARKLTTLQRPAVNESQEDTSRVPRLAFRSVAAPFAKLPPPQDRKTVLLLQKFKTLEPPACFDLVVNALILLKHSGSISPQV